MMRANTYCIIFGKTQPELNIVFIDSKFQQLKNIPVYKSFNWSYNVWQQGHVQVI
jgi:hypothetical protein